MVLMDERTTRLFGEIAAVVEMGDYTYQEAISVLQALKEEYEANANLLVNETSIMDVAKYRQRRYEKSLAGRGESETADEREGDPAWRENMIRRYENRLAALKSGATPSEVVSYKR